MPGGTNQVRQLLLWGFGGLLLLLAFTGLNGLVSPRENSKPATPPSAKTTSTMIASSPPPIPSPRFAQAGRAGLGAAEADVVAALLRCRGCAIPMDDADVQMIMFLQRRYRPNENGVQTTVRLPPAKGAVNARVVDLRTTLLILFYRQFLPLAPKVKDLQDVVEDRVQGQFGRWSPAPQREMGQDKLLELFQTQMGWNALPPL